MEKQDRTRICYLISSLCNEGPVNVVYNILSFMDYSCFDVTVITLTAEKPQSRIEEFKKLPVTVVQLNPDGALSFRALHKKLKKTVEDISPEIIHAHCGRSLLHMSLLPHTFKSLFTVHIFPGIQQIQMMGPVKGYPMSMLLHGLTARCDMAVACSESVKEQYLQEKGLDIECVPNGASFPVWKRDEDERARLRTGFGMQPDWKYFIFIGRFSGEKNPGILLDVFARLQDEHLGLIMLGNGPEWERLHGSNVRNVIMPGFTDRVYDYLKASDYYISASDVEGLANTILESMSVGLPMVLSNIPSHREVLRNFSDDSAGLTVNQHDVDEILSKVRKIIGMDTSRSAGLIQKVYETKYSAETMSAGYQRLYFKSIQQ